MRRFLAVISIVLLTITASAQSDFPVLVGVVTDNSGYDASAGRSHLNGFYLGLLYAAGVDPLEVGNLEDALAQVAVAGRNIEVLVRDYGANNPDTALENGRDVARDLIEFEFVDILIGAPDAAVTQQLQEFAAPNNFDFILFAGPSGAREVTQVNFHVNTFRLCPHIEQYGRASTVDATGYIMLSGGIASETVDSLNDVPPGTEILTPYVPVDTEVNRWLIERYEPLFGTQPELYTGCGFATGQAIYAALQTTDGDPFPDVMIPALENMTIDAPEGEYTIRAGDHQALRRLFVTRFNAAGEPLEITDEISAEASAIDCVFPRGSGRRC